MQTKHTSGPWTALSRSVVAEDGLSICELPKRSRVMLGAHGLREQEAIDPENLRLIAASPAMLAALRFVLADLNSTLDVETALLIQHAIAEATGD